jgi:hypothetical protein
MGACTSTNGKGQIRIDKNEGKLDFEYFRDLIREQKDNKIYEVKAKLYEVSKINHKATLHTLMCKYLFFQPNGKFTSQIRQNISGEELFVEGTLDKTGAISLTYKQKMLNNNALKVKYFEGKMSEGSNYKFVGQVHVDSGQGKTLVENASFVLNFSTKLYKVEYTNKNNKPFSQLVNLSLKDKVFSGFSYDDKGFSVWAGIDKDNKAILIQQYLDKNYVNGSGLNENGTFSFEGDMDKINNTIEGQVKNKKLEIDTNFMIKFIGKNSSN